MTSWRTSGYSKRENKEAWYTNMTSFQAHTNTQPKQGKPFSGGTFLAEIITLYLLLLELWPNRGRESARQ